MIEIIISPHTLDRAVERGTNEHEIQEVIKTGIPLNAKQGRLAKSKIFPFNAERGKKFYPEKRVEVVYLEENKQLITVTVYVFYGKWEKL